jgi:AcrR family transcriptional regulator
MPKIWAETMDTHRRQVNDAILDATAALIAEHGPMSVSMSAIAERVGIGRATLYKYFPDVEAILIAWHARAFSGHQEQLEALAGAEDITLDDVAAFVRAQRRHHKGVDLVDNLAQTLAGAHGDLKDTVHSEVMASLTTVMTRLAQRKQARTDHAPDVLARWLLHAVHAPAALDDRAVTDLVITSLAPLPTRPKRARSG